MTPTHALHDSASDTTSRDTRPGQNSVPFPSQSEQPPVAIPDSTSSSSDRTSSDKLSELPTQSSPALGGRFRSPSRLLRRGLDPSGSLTSVDSPSGSLQALHQLPRATHASESDGSIGLDTPRQRASLESDRASLPTTLQGIRHAIANRRVRRSHSMTRSPSPLSGEGSLRGPHTPTQPAASEQSHNPAQNFSPRLGRDPHTPTSRSPSQSRAASPLRRLGWALHRVHAREEPFVPVDPFRIGFFGPASKGDRVSVMQRPDSDNDIECKDAFGGCLPLPVLSPCKTKDGESEGGSWKDVFRDARTFLTDTLPRQFYLILLLGLPALYWSRVTRVFEDAELSRPDVQRMIDACTRDPNDRGPEGVPGTRDRSVPSRHTVLLPFPEEWNPPMVSPALVRFKHSWEQFVDSLLREWKTLNLVSALLCTAILTMFQVDDAEDDPVTRSAALFGLVFALMSLCYGCVFIVQFGTMRTMDRASRWAEEAQRTKTAILWNIWVLLAAPAIWLAWSMIAFCVSILSYVWRTGSIANQTPPSPLSTRQAIGVRTAITVVFALGLFKFAMIIRTFSSYHGARRERRRMREEMLGGKVRDERERGRRDAMEEVRERESRAGSASMVGLGLTGLSEHALASPGMASLTGVVRDEGDPEKADFLSIEKGRGRLRISPKL